MFPELSSLESAIALTEALARRAGRDDIGESVRAFLSSAHDVHNGEKALAEGGWTALRGAAVSQNSIWVIEIGAYEDKWRFVFRVPVGYAAALDAAAASEASTR